MYSNWGKMKKTDKNQSVEQRHELKVKATQRSNTVKRFNGILYQSSVERCTHFLAIP